MTSLLETALGLVLPVECPGCGAWDTALCPQCRSLLDGAPRRCEQDAPALAGAGEAPALLPVWTLGAYTGPVRGLVMAWKRNRPAELERAVAEAAQQAGRAWAAELTTLLPPAGDVWVLPAPSGWRRRAQGQFVVGALARSVAAGLAQDRSAGASTGVVGGPGPGPDLLLGPGPGRRGAGRRPARAAPRVLVADVLRRGPGRAHQAGLGVAGRTANRRHGTRVRPGLPARATCLLVDDVLTTGATLAAARAALVAAGHVVPGALVLAATPTPRGRL